MSANKQSLYVVMVDVHDEHGKRKMQFPKEVYSSKGRANEAAARMNGRNLGDRVTFAHVIEVPYFPTEQSEYSIEQP
jgi:hypothetical protein